MCVTHTVEHNYIYLVVQMEYKSTCNSLGHGTHCWSNEILTPPPAPNTLKEHPTHLV